MVEGTLPHTVVGRNRDEEVPRDARKLRNVLPLVSGGETYLHACPVVVFEVFRGDSGLRVPNHIGDAREVEKGLVGPFVGGAVFWERLHEDVVDGGVDGLVHAPDIALGKSGPRGMGTLHAPCARVLQEAVGTESGGGMSGNRQGPAWNAKKVESA